MDAFLTPEKPCQFHVECYRNYDSTQHFGQKYVESYSYLYPDRPAKKKQ